MQLIKDEHTNASTIDWQKLAQTLLTSRALDDLEEFDLVKQKKVLYQFSARGHDMAQIMLVTALELDLRNPEFVWRNDHPALLAWLARFADRPSVTSTRPDRPIEVA